MSWHLFDERGRRAQKLTIGWVGSHFTVLPGHRLTLLRGSDTTEPIATLYPMLGFDPERSWRPTYFAAAMSRGYRVFELDVGEHEYVDQSQLLNWWQPASPGHRRVPTMAALEVLLRHLA